MPLQRRSGELRRHFNNVPVVLFLFLSGGWSSGITGRAASAGRYPISRGNWKGATVQRSANASERMALSIFRVRGLDWHSSYLRHSF